MFAARAAIVDVSDNSDTQVKVRTELAVNGLLCRVARALLGCSSGCYCRSDLQPLDAMQYFVILYEELFANTLKFKGLGL